MQHEREYIPYLCLMALSLGDFRRLFLPPIFSVDSRGRKETPCSGRMDVGLFASTECALSVGDLKYLQTHQLLRKVCPLLALNLSFVNGEAMESPRHLLPLAGSCWFVWESFLSKKGNLGLREAFS